MTKGRNTARRMKGGEGRTGVKVSRRLRIRFALGKLGEGKLTAGGRGGMRREGRLKDKIFQSLQRAGPIWRRTQRWVDEESREGNGPV